MNGQLFRKSRISKLMALQAVEYYYSGFVLVVSPIH